MKDKDKLSEAEKANLELNEKFKGEKKDGPETDLFIHNMPNSLLIKSVKNQTEDE